MALKHLFLPKLIPGASISEPANDAVWDNKDHQVIQSISDGIEVDEVAQTRGVSSIPDIYARPLTFLGGFRSARHPLRKRIVQEWRGLLSLLALHEVKPDLGRLKITPVILNDEKFATALRNLADTPVKLEKNGTPYLWTDFLLITFNDIPLGAFSPATLVFTSADYNKRLQTEAFSLKDEDGYLKPPGKPDGLDAVGKWLENFITQFNQLAQTAENKGGDHRYVGGINKMLDAWLTDIRVELDLAPNESIRADTVRVADDMMESLKENPPQMLRKYAIYRQLLIPLVLDETATVHYSDYSLLKARNKLHGINEVVVITAGLLGRNLNLWRGTSPSELDKDPAILIDKFFISPFGNLINNINLQKDDSIWIRPELYFLSDNLLTGKNNDILNDAEKFLNAGKPEYMLPFKKEILYFFSPEEIQQQLQPRFEVGNTKVSFTFTLPLVNNIKVEIKKTYRRRGEARSAGEGLLLETDIPAIEIFPNFSGNFWCQYFLMNSMTDAFSINPINYEAAHVVSKKIQAFESNELKVKIELQRISGYNSFPEAVEITYHQNLSGLVLLRRNPDFNNAKFDNEDEVTIGVDFGTSNTNIYYLKDGEPDKISLLFADYTRKLTNASPQHREEIEQQFFVPVKNVELPIPTTLRRYYSGQSEFILFDHFIYFPTGYKYDKNVSSNIKWDSDDSKMNCFIKSLVFLLMLDVVQKKMGNVRIKCTYPKSFSDQKKSAYNATWQLALQSSIQFGDDYKTSTHHETLLFARADASERSVNIDGSHYTIPSNRLGKLLIDTSPEFVSEGEATGHYFSSEKIFTGTINRANKKFGAICIDVGGGTTDFSVWYNSEIVYDCSVSLAGGQISEVIASNTRLYALLFSETAVKALQSAIGNPVQFSSVLNYILKKEGPDISARIIKNVNSKEIAWLRRTIAIEFGALSFFAGHIALAVNKFTGGSAFRNAIRENGIRLHWGGNAAKLISWIDYGKFDPDGIAVKFLNGMFMNAIINPALDGAVMDRPALLGQVQSISHKDEAAGGAVLMTNSTAARATALDEIDEYSIYGKEDAGKMEGLVLSEPMTIDNINYKHFDILKREQFFNEQLSLVHSIKLEQFDEFIKVLNGIGKRNGLFSEDHQIKFSEAHKTALRAEIIAGYDALAQAPEARRVVQPPFITAVSQFLKEYANISR